MSDENQTERRVKTAPGFIEQPDGTFVVNPDLPPEGQEAARQCLKDAIGSLYFTLCPEEDGDL